MISVIIPSLDRPHKLIPVLNDLKLNSRLLVEAIVVLDEEDIASKNAVCNYGASGVSIPLTVRVLKGHPTPIEKWNHGAKHSTGSWIMLAADDIEFTRNWDQISFDTPNKGFLAFRDTPESRKNFEPHYMATREWLRMYNGGVLATPHYRHWCPDVEIADRAKAQGHYKVSNAIIPHKHYLFGTATKDSTYEKGQVHYMNDLQLLKRRQEQGYLDDFESYL